MDDDNNDIDEQHKSDLGDSKMSSSKLDVVKILMNDWQWRHAHCWKTLQRFGLGALTVAAIPYAKSDIFQGNIYALFFPVASAVIALFATALFAAEYVRCRPIETKYYEVLGKDSPFFNKPQTGIWPSVGRSTIFLFIVGSTVISVANAWILLRVINMTVAPWEFELYAIGSIILSIILGRILARWSGKRIKEFSETPLPKQTYSQQNLTQDGHTPALTDQQMIGLPKVKQTQTSNRPSQK